LPGAFFVRSDAFDREERCRTFVQELAAVSRTRCKSGNECGTLRFLREASIKLRCAKSITPFVESGERNQTGRRKKEKADPSRHPQSARVVRDDKIKAEAKKEKEGKNHHARND
jgi:hypothetical protein